MVADLALPWRQLAYGKVASGRVEQFDIHEALVRWGRQLQKLLVYRSDVQPLLGMQMLYGYDLRLQVVDGGAVTIRRLGMR